MMVLDKKQTCTSFPSLWIVVGNVIVLVPERKFPSQCNVVIGNPLVLMLEESYHLLAFLHDAMYFLAMHLCL